MGRSIVVVAAVDYLGHQLHADGRCARAPGLGIWLLDRSTCELRCLTFELSGRRRQGARPGLAKMYRVPPDRAWWPAVGAPLERGVRHHSFDGSTLTESERVAYDSIPS